ncbi:MAG: hypothetical protein F9K38_16225 [Pseudorhodoplanes sp.]|nr:MAG: hypothetical protein F9K38_16225 [Pseudorhodoplanes sp.]
MRYRAWPIAVTAVIVLTSHGWAGDLARWEGWIVGEPCVDSLQISDCPLRFRARPVLLQEDGSHLSFAHGDKSTLKHPDIDAAYGRKVVIQGEMKDGVVVPARLDVLEVVGEKKFFKGCL